MSYQEFQEAFEKHSENVFAEFNLCTEDDLLNIVSARKSKYNIWKGEDNYQIWTVLGIKGKNKSIEPLFAVVSNLKNDYLVRYHACHSLFKIAGIEDADFKGQVQYGLDSNRQKVNQSKAIEKLGEILNLEVEKKNIAWWKFW